MRTPNLTRLALLGLLTLAGLPSAWGQTITPAMAVPPGSVDTSKPGFKMRIVQGTSATTMTAANPAEGLITGRIKDANGDPLNLATPNGDGTFTYEIPGVINTHEQAANGATGGNFSTAAAAPHNIADEPTLGIPGTTGNGDYFVQEYTGYLDLPAGTVRFGVNSDDGFKLTIGSGINSRIPGLQLIILDGTRGFGNTEANITVTQAGIYPFRLLYWENTGANSGVELFTFAPGATSGNRYLVNDRSQASAIKSYREALGNPPTVLNVSPALSTFVTPTGVPSAVPPAPFIWADIQDGSTTLATSGLELLLDGKALATQTSKTGNISMISAQAPQLAAGSLHTNVLIYADSGGKKYTNTWTFTVGSYVTLPAEYALPSVDTTKPGFRAKLYQIDVNRNPATGVVPNAERQIAGGYRDANGQPYPNTASTDWMAADGTVLGSADASGYFTIPEFINWNQDAPTGAGNFSSASSPPFEDQPVPGLTGNQGPNTTDRAVFSIETILQLKAGPIRLGVASDDGFRLSAGRGPGDVIGVQLGTAGDRGTVDSYMDFVVPVDGYYPFRLMWFETGGGATCEFFVIDPATGQRALINDGEGFTPIPAYRESPTARPYVSRVLPAVNYIHTFADEDLIIDVTDGATALDPASVILRLNGTAVTPTVKKDGKVTTLTRPGGINNLLPSGTVNVQLILAGTGGSPATNNWSFTVPAYTRPIPAGNKVAESQVNNPGFKVKAHQIDRTKDSNQGNGGRYTGQNGGGSNMPRPEIQLADGYINPADNLPYPNLAAPGPNADGTYDIPDVLNWNSAQSAGGPPANAGIFNGDVSVPGLPGTGTSNFGLDNTVHEITTYLSLKAGAHVFGLNVDDGWLAISAPNPRDTLGTLLGWRNAPGGQNGNPLNNPNAAFNVIVPEDGVYPFRILFWQGGGGVNLEFLSIDRNTGTQTLVNDVGGSFPSVVALGGNLVNPVAAFNTYTGPARPWVRNSVYPMPTHATLWQNIHQQSGPGPITVRVPAANPVDIANDEPRFDQAIVNRPFGDAVGAVIANLGAGSVGMVLDGNAVTPTVTDVAGSSDKLVLYTPNPPMASGSTHTAGLVYAGTTNYWTFTVSTYTNVPASYRRSVEDADTTAPGFKVKVVQAAAAQANTVARAEAQLAGTPASVAIPGPEADGSYIDSNVINWNVTANPGATLAEIGNFRQSLTGTPDEPVPGIPGTGLAGAPRYENITAEIFAWLDLPAGYQKFGIGGDDGFKLQIGTPGQTDGTILFSRDRGAGPRDIPIAFIVPEAGLYPVRLVWYQGGGGGNLEFFSYGPNNSKIMVNDRSNPAAVKAYAKVKGGGVPPSVAIQNLPAGLVVTFQGKLQSTDALGAGANWQDVANATSPLTVSPTGTAKFYRAVGQ